MKQIIASILLCLSNISFGAVPMPLPVEQCRAQVPFGAPVSNKTSTTRICRQGYMLEHDNSARIPVWVSYTLTPEHAVGCFPRVSRFVPEPGLSSDSTAVMSDYAKSGYDIGHMANDSDMRWSAETEEESNIFANATPQLPEFNRGIWKKLEDGTRGWAISRQHSLTIYIAPVYSKTDTLLRGRVIVPHAFIKIIIDDTTKEVMIFWFQHAGSKENLNTFITSFANAQALTSVKFPMPKKPVFSTSIWKVDLKSNRAAKTAICN